MGIGKISAKAFRSIKRHSPVILTGLGIGGMTAGIILAVKATPKAEKLIADKEKELGRPLTRTEKVKTAWKCYLPTAAVGLGAAGCMVGVNVEYTKRQAALAAAYKIAVSGLQEYTAKTQEIAGDKITKQIEDSIAQSRVEKHPPKEELPETTQLVTSEMYGLHWCLDGAFGQVPFLCNWAKLCEAINIINDRLNKYDFASLNEFYDQVGLPNIKIGNRLGWNRIDGLVELKKHAAEINGQPCLVFDYSIYPRYDYDRS